MTTLSFFVPGKPAPQGSKRHIGRGRMLESSKEVGPWRQRVAIAAHNAMTTARIPLLTGRPITLELDFVMPRPQRTPRSTPPAIRRPDTDKVSRAVLDALSHTVYADDAQVVDLHARKRLAAIDETPGVHITVTAGEPA
jgi:crossover junction endodeoxyribonuclease RusA